jgi:hypothetical protein
MWPALWSNAEPIAGPFDSVNIVHQRSATYFYIDNPDGQAFDVTVRCVAMHMRQAKPYPRLMVRVFDANEQRIHRSLIAAEQRVTVRVPRGDPGVVVVAISGGTQPEATFDVTTQPPLPLGIMSSLDAIVPPRQPVKRGYVYVPAGAKELIVTPRDADVTIWDERGGVLLQNESKHLHIERTDVVWRIAMSAKRRGGMIRAEGFPVIVCPSEQTARRIGGSIERLDDGTIVAHKFQVRLDRLLRQTFDAPDDLAIEPIESLAAYADAAAIDPFRHDWLFTGYSAPLPMVRFWLQRQVTDPASPHFGGIHGPSDYGNTSGRYVFQGSPLNSDDGQPPPPMPDATDRLARRYWSSFSLWATPGALAFLYELDPKVNPYHHNRQLLNRAIIAACRDMMLLTEDEVITDDSDGWPGHFGFIFKYQQTEAYARIGQVVKQQYPQIWDAWTQGMTRYADRLSHMNVFFPANQGAHYLEGLWNVYEGSGDEWYRDQTLRSTEELVAFTHRPAGYGGEGYGPCASYNGLTLSIYADLYHRSRMDVFKTLCQRAYRLFNHTVCAEPDGTIIGACDFNHRVAMPWPVSQSSAGRTIMAQYLEEAGVWYRDSRTDDKRHELAARIRKRAGQIPLAESDIAASAKLQQWNLQGMARFRYDGFAEHVLDGGRFPFEEDQPFMRNFGDEFICVKRPAYYTVAYVGKPGLHQAALNAKPDEKGARTGGGLSLLWFPDYGTVWAGQGWNIDCHHGLVVEQSDGMLRSAEYGAVEFDFDEASGQLMVDGQINGTPLRYQYRYRFEPDQLHHTVRVEADEAMTAKSVVMQFPLFASKARGFNVDLTSQNAGIIRVTDDTGAGVQWRFAEPVNASIGRTTRQSVGVDQYVITTLEVSMPSRWEVGAVRELAYEVEPIRRDVLRSN